MKVYITKYALTHGIVSTDAVRDPKEPQIIRVKRGKNLRSLRANDWHSNIKLAKARAEEMRTAKLISLSNQAMRIEAIKF